MFGILKRIFGRNKPLGDINIPDDKIPGTYVYRNIQYTHFGDFEIRIKPPKKFLRKQAEFKKIVPWYALEQDYVPLRQADKYILENPISSFQDILSKFQHLCKKPWIIAFIRMIGNEGYYFAVSRQPNFVVLFIDTNYFLSCEKENKDIRGVFYHELIHELRSISDYSKKMEKYKSEHHNDLKNYLKHPGMFSNRPPADEIKNIMEDIAVNKTRDYLLRSDAKTDENKAKRILKSIKKEYQKQVMLSIESTEKILGYLKILPELDLFYLLITDVYPLKNLSGLFGTEVLVNAFDYEGLFNLEKVEQMYKRYNPNATRKDIQKRLSLMETWLKHTNNVLRNSTPRLQKGVKDFHNLAIACLANIKSSDQKIDEGSYEEQYYYAPITHVQELIDFFTDFMYQLKESK